MPERHLRQLGFTHSASGPFTKKQTKKKKDKETRDSLPDGSVDIKVIIFVVHVSSSVHINSKEKDILIIGIVQRPGLQELIFQD